MNRCSDSFQNPFSNIAYFLMFSEKLKDKEVDISTIIIGIRIYYESNGIETMFFYLLVDLAIR